MSMESSSEVKMANTNASSNEVNPGDAGGSTLEMESAKLMIPSQECPITRSPKCIRCNIRKVAPTCAYYNNHDKTLYISRSPRAMSLASIDLPPRSSEVLDDTPTITCTNCRRNTRWRTNCYCDLCKNYWGIMLSLLSGLASTFGGLIVRRMKDFHPFNLATYRFQGILLPTLFIVLYYHFIKKQNVFQTIWPLKDKDKLVKFGFTIMRAATGCLGLYLYFYAIQLIPLADAKVILSCRPVFVIFVAHIFLAEPCGLFPVFAALLSMLGCGIIARPPILTGDDSFDSDTLTGTIFATLSMLAATLSMVVLRYLRGVHVAVVTLAFGFWGTILSIACSATVERFDVPHTRQEWFLMLGLAISAFFSQTAITLAMKYEHAGAVVIVSTCDTIMSFVLQYFILGDVPDKYSIVGAALIVICVSLITIRKWIRSLPESHSIRRTFCFVLK